MGEMNASVRQGPHVDVLLGKEGAARFREAVVEPDRHRDQIESSNSVYVLQRASVWE